MNQKQIVESLKKNKRSYCFLSKEEQEFLKKHWEDTVYGARRTNAVSKINSAFFRGGIYCLRPDFELPYGAELEELQWEMCELQAAIHYPECWDTMTYPTFLSALTEIGCSAEHKVDEPEKDRCDEMAEDICEILKQYGGHSYDRKIADYLREELEGEI